MRNKTSRTWFKHRSRKHINEDVIVAEAVPDELFSKVRLEIDHTIISKSH